MRLVAAAAIAFLLLACQPGNTDAKGEATGDAEPAVGTPIDPPVVDAGALPGKGDADPASKDPEAEPTHPRLVVTTLDGSQYDLAARRGRWVVVNYWATWCNPCLKEMPELSALAGMREDIEVVGLAYEDIEPAEMQAFLRKHPVLYPIAIIDTYAPPADFAEPRGLPMTYLIAPDGRVERQIFGPVTAADIEQIIAAASDAGAGGESEVRDAT